MSGLLKVLVRREDVSPAFDVAMMYGFLLGREPESEAVVEEHAKAPRPELLRGFIESKEFWDGVLEPISRGEPVVRREGSPRPTLKQLSWLESCIDLHPEVMTSLRRAPGWDRVFRLLCIVEGFSCSRMGGAPSKKSALDGGSRAERGDLTDRLGKIEGKLQYLSESLLGNLNQSSTKDLFAFDRICALRQRGLPPLPNLVGVGAGRCGTTTVHRYLAEHPDVHLPALKELNFFGVRSTTALGSERGITSDLYRMYFNGNTGQRFSGDFSPVYLTQPGAAEEMRKLLGPECRIIIQIRHPVERFLSQYEHHFRWHGYTSLENYVEAALSPPRDASPWDWFSPAKNLSQSLYAEAIDRFTGLFGRKNVVILDFGMLGTPGYISERLSCFLGLQRLTGETQVSNATTSRPRLSAELRRRMLAYFEQDVASTQDLTGLDLSSWHR